MSHNPSRSGRSEMQYRKTGRSASLNQQRNSSGSQSKGAGAGPSPSQPVTPSSHSLSSNRSFKKSENAQGGQVWSNVPSVNSSQPGSSSTPHNQQNAAHVQPQLQRVSDAPVAPVAPKPNEPLGPQRSSRAVPKAPTSQSTTLNTESSKPKTPEKVPGDAAKAFPFQFGSLSPGLMNGMQIPARTSSAPPNLDEQKRAQNPPTPVQRQQLQNKAADLSNTEESRPALKEKKDTHVSSAPPPTSLQKAPVLSAPITSTQLPLHPPQVPLQFGGSNLQVQPPSVTATSLQMAMPLQMGNTAHMQQPVLVPGLQSHPMSHQGIMHQGPGLRFTSPMGPQLPPQLGHMGLGMMPQYPQQQGGKFGSQRKTPVKITHPETREELRLDKRPDINSHGGSTSRPYPSIPHQSHPAGAFSHSHPMNYFPSSYNTSMYFPPSSLPLTSGQMMTNPQAPQFSYPVSQASQNVQYVDSSAHKLTSMTRPGALSNVASHSTLEDVRDGKNTVLSASSGSTVVTIKSVPISTTEKVHDSFPSSPSVTENVRSSKPSRPSEEVTERVLLRDVQVCLENSSQQLKSSNGSVLSSSVPEAAAQNIMAQAAALSDNLGSNEVPSVPAISTGEAAKSEDGVGKTLLQSNSFKDHQKKPGNQGHTHLSHQESKCGVVSNIKTSNIMDDKAMPTADVSLMKAGRIFDGVNDVSFELSNCGASGDAVDNTNLDTSAQQRNMKQETQGTDGEKRFPENNMKHDPNSEVSKNTVASKSLNHANQMKGESNITRETIVDQIPSGEIEECKLDEPESEDTGDLAVSGTMDSTNAGSSPVEKTSVLNASSAGIPDSRSFSNSSVEAGALKREDEISETSCSGSVAVAASVSHDKSSLESNRGKNATSRAKKKRKEILQKADAAGTTADLYMAYKGPEEEKEAVVSTENIESVSVHANTQQAAAGCSGQDASVSRDNAKDKAEPDDWEDAADLNASPMDSLDDVQLAHGEPLINGKVGSGNLEKKYSRDFLLKFADRCNELPQSFEIAPDIVETLMSFSSNSHRLSPRDSHVSPGRVMDRLGSGPRIDRRAGAVVEDDRWSKFTGSFGSGRDPRMDMGYVGNLGFRPVQANFGVLRNPRAQAPGPYAGGILSGPMQSMGSHGGMARNNPDADRWQRAKGLIPSPKTPMQMMHKAEKKYEVGKVTDEEQAKQRRLKGILNKLTPQNFEKLFEQVKEVNIDNAGTLTRVISQIFDKALMEPTFCEMYANFCFYLAGELPDFVDGEQKITFKRLLLNKCQEEFERGEREEEEANKVEEGEDNQTEQEREEKRVKVRRRMLGNIRLIGELYKKGMLTERIMHSCIQKLLGQYPDPDEEDIEALCKLMSTIGEMFDHPKAKEHIDSYFESLTVLSNNKKLSSRVRFMLKDIIDLRKNKWQQRRKIEGPKKIEEVHRDAAQERQTQTSRLSRGPGFNSSARRGSTDFGARGSSMVFSPSPQMGGFRGLAPQVRGFGAQDSRFEDRPAYEPRALSVLLSQRPAGDETITLGPQGGLGRGMSVRGSQYMPSVPITDVPCSTADSRRTTASHGVSPISERMTYSSREDVPQRLGVDRMPATSANEPSNAQERRLNYGNRDLRNAEPAFDRPLGTSSPSQGQGTSVAHNVSSEKVLSEDLLHEKSMATIKEFYSARDEKEVALCIKDLHSSGFHSRMVSLWVTDSFERKDAERDLLAKLLIYLVKSVDGTLSQAQLMKGFESVLAGLEDAVYDAPRAAEFLGRIFAKVILEDVIPLGEVERLIHEGGEEPGRLLEIGLAGDVLGTTLEIIKSEKGKAGLNDIRASSDLRLEDFRPRSPNRSKMLENFI